MSPEMKSNLDSVCNAIDKKWGKGTLMKLTDIPVLQPDDIIPTGSIQLDLALGVGGYRKGRIIEIIGQESTGKSTLCLHAVANAQKQGKICCYLDAENAFDPLYAQSLGVDLEKLLFSQPDFGEQALGIVDDLIRSREVQLIIIDSVAALIPQKELEGDIGDQLPGLQARMMSQAMRKIAGVCNKTDSTIIFVNQYRNKIGVMFGSPWTTTGGNSLKYYASQRIKIQRIGSVKVKDEEIGNKTRVEVIKNKLAPPKKIAEFNILYGKGIDTDREVLDLAVMDGLVTKSGAWFKYNNESVAQGESNAISWLNDNKDIKYKLLKEILEGRGLDFEPPKEESIMTKDLEDK